MQTGVVTREFSFNGVKLPDPDPKLSLEQVRSEALEHTVVRQKVAERGRILRVVGAAVVF